MSAPTHVRSAFGVARRVQASIPAATSGAINATAQSRRHRSTALEKLVTSEGRDIEEIARNRGMTLPSSKLQYDAETQSQIDSLAEPQNLTALHLRPLRRQPTHGIPVCDLQLRTYSMRNMDVFADFALRAAYYLKLPAKGPIPLPRITERWTVPRANFIFKKSQENFERITMRRLIQIQDGHPETVRLWLGILMKHQYHGIGMKANVWEFDSLDSATNLEKELEKAEVRAQLDKIWENYGTRADIAQEGPGPDAIRHPQHTGPLVEQRRELERERFEVQERLAQVAENSSFEFSREPQTFTPEEASTLADSGVLRKMTTEEKTASLEAAAQDAHTTSDLTPTSTHTIQPTTQKVEETLLSEMYTLNESALNAAASKAGLGTDDATSQAEEAAEAAQEEDVAREAEELLARKQPDSSNPTKITADSAGEKDPEVSSKEPTTTEPEGARLGDENPKKPSS